MNANTDDKKENWNPVSVIIPKGCTINGLHESPSEKSIFQPKKYTLHQVMPTWTND